MDVDFIVFGHGHAGALRNKEYDGAEFVEFLAAGMAQAIRPGERIIPQALRWERFRVVTHTSEFDHKIYLLAVADEFEPQNVDVRILHERPRPKPIDL
ncbi:hypothetical protein [Serratia plymuthica]|uniref:hypothetical protein n=1 Tax=Serratia plymuthica TaxID=82996 RepID=UPI00055B232D|nr:hypothetical protein [Serratia plymuthica]